jgi:hypothetical protein
MKSELVVAVLAAVLGGVAVRECFPRTKEVLKPVPSIVTIHDVVHDTVRLKGPKTVTTDTINLIVRVTIHDTVQINVGADTSARQPLWPILNVQIGKSRGDTSQVTTFSLRSGQTAVSRVWTPGPVKSIWVVDNQTPRMDFYDPPASPSVSLWTKGKWTAVGYAARTLQCLLSHC